MPWWWLYFTSKGRMKETGFVVSIFAFFFVFCFFSLKTKKGYLPSIFVCAKLTVGRIIEPASLESEQNVILTNWKYNIIIIIALKDAVRDCLQSPHCTTNCHQHVHSSGPGAIVYKLFAAHSPHGLAFSRRGCFSTKLAHSFLSHLCLSFCLPESFICTSFYPSTSPNISAVF